MSGMNVVEALSAASGFGAPFEVVVLLLVLVGVNAAVALWPTNVRSES